MHLNNPLVVVKYGLEKKSIQKTRKPADKEFRENREPVDLVRSDLCGPIGSSWVANVRYCTSL